MKSIYLAGAGNAFEYRKKCKDLYGKKFRLFDPISDSDRLFEELNLGKSIKEVFEEFEAGNKNILNDDIKTSIVINDKNNISECDILVAYVEKATFGTTMEILFAWERHKPVYVINPEMTLIEDIWLSYHTTRFFDSIEDCFEFLQSK